MGCPPQKLILLMATNGHWNTSTPILWEEMTRKHACMRRMERPEHLPVLVPMVSGLDLKDPRDFAPYFATLSKRKDKAIDQGKKITTCGLYQELKVSMALLKKGLDSYNHSKQ